jgi:hypothetical protein
MIRHETSLYKLSQTMTELTDRDIEWATSVRVAVGVIGLAKCSPRSRIHHYVMHWMLMSIGDGVCLCEHRSTASKRVGADDV